MVVLHHSMAPDGSLIKISTKGCMALMLVYYYNVYHSMTVLFIKCLLQHGPNVTTA